MKNGNPMQGSISILIVLIMLTLSIFGVLSLVSAYSDYKLAVKSADTLAVNYELDTEGQKELTTLAEALRDVSPESGLAMKTVREMTAIGLGWEKLSDEPSLFARTITQDNRHLHIELECLFDEQGLLESYTVTTWRQSQDDFEYNEGLSIWQG